MAQEPSYQSLMDAWAGELMASAFWMRSLLLAQTCLVAGMVGSLALAAPSTEPRKGVFVAPQPDLRERSLRSMDQVPMPAAPSASSTSSARLVDYVLKATIEEVAPVPTTEGETFTVRALVVPSGYDSLREVERRLTVFLDGQEAIRVAPQATSLSKLSGPASSPGISFGRPQGAAEAAGPAGLDFLLLAPKGYRADNNRRSVVVSLYSVADGRTVASKVLEVPASPGAAPASSPQLAVGSLWSGPTAPLSLAAVAVAIALLSATYALRRSQRARQLEAEMVKARDVSHDVQRTIQAAKLDAPSAGTADNQTPTVPELPSSIVDAAVDGRLALVLGAGASAQAGLPTSTTLWLNVLSNVQRKGIVPADDMEQLRGGVLRYGPYQVLDAIAAKVGKEQIASALREELTVGRKVGSAFHDSLSRLGAQIIVDMTWDMVAPTIFQRQGARVFTPSDAQGITAALRQGQVCIFKPLGSPSDPESLCLTNQEFRRALNRSPEFERALASVFSTHSVLFLGLGLPGIEDLLKALPPLSDLNRRQHVAVTPRSPADELWEVGTGAAFGVKLARYVPGPTFAEVGQMAKRLVDEIERRRPSSETAKGSGTASSFEQPVLCKVRLQNIGVFDELEIDINSAWTVFLGNNGGGKSTILRAIALAMFGADPRAAVPAQKMLKNGKSSGSVILEFDKDSVTTELTRDVEGVVVSGSSHSPLLLGRMLVLGFPVLRGVTLTNPKGASRQPTLEPSVNDVAPLLTGLTDSRLDDIKQWLLNIMVAAKEQPNGREAHMLQTVKRVLEAMLPGQSIQLSRFDPKTFAILVNTPDGEVEFESISQGMASIFNWVGVLIRRLYDTYPKSPRPEHERALVLVDEIDAHLHPRWQRRLVELSRKEFPKVQIVATTHSPLLAGAVSAGELRIVERSNETGRMTVSPSPMDFTGQRVEDILTSPLFNLDTTRNPEAERTIRRYFTLYERPSGSLTEQERNELNLLKDEMARLNYGGSLPVWAVAEMEPKLSPFSEIEQAFDGLSDADIVKLNETLASKSATSKG